MVLDIGSALREARQRQGLDYAQVEAQLRIRAHYLAALEEERFEVLPGEAYAKGFLRSYAEFLGLDGNRFLDEYNARTAGDQRAPLSAEFAPIPHAPRPQSRPLLLVGVLVAAVVVAGLVVLGLALGGSHSKQTVAKRPVTAAPAPAHTHPARRTPPRRRQVGPFVRVGVRAVGAWDPNGDRQEHDAEAVYATDGNPATYWSTETYAAGLQKPGVGLLLDSGRPVLLRRLVVTTDKPGYVALIEAGPSATGPFRPLSATRTLAATTAFFVHGSAQCPRNLFRVQFPPLAAARPSRASGSVGA